MHGSHLWANLLYINTALMAIASWYTIYAAGASLYYLSWKPIAVAIIITFSLLVMEVIFGGLGE